MSMDSGNAPGEALGAWLEVAGGPKCEYQWATQVDWSWAKVAGVLPPCTAPPVAVAHELDHRGNPLHGSRPFCLCASHLALWAGSPDDGRWERL